MTRRVVIGGMKPKPESTAKRVERLLNQAAKSLEEGDSDNGVFFYLQAVDELPNVQGAREFLRLYNLQVEVLKKHHSKMISCKERTKCSKR